MRWATEPGVYICTIAYTLFQLLYLPAHSLRILLVPPFLYVLWTVFAPCFFGEETASRNPFGPIFLLTGYIPESSEDDPRYAKTWYDLVFIAYYIVFFSFVRQVIAVNLAQRIVLSYGIRLKEGKIERLGEQLYAVLYFTATGISGYVKNHLISDAKSLIHFQCTENHAHSAD
jgi:very-long-chain ceramide synthase